MSCLVPGRLPDRQNRSTETSGDLRLPGSARERGQPREAFGNSHRIAGLTVPAECLGVLAAGAGAFSPPPRNLGLGGERHGDTERTSVPANMADRPNESLRRQVEIASLHGGDRQPPLGQIGGCQFFERPGRRECIAEQVLRPLVLALVERDEAEHEVHIRDASCIPELPADCEALLGAGECELVISEHPRHRARGLGRISPGHSSFRRTRRKRLIGPTQPFRKPAGPAPVDPKGAGQPHPGERLPVLDGPGEGCADVVPVGVQHVEVLLIPGFGMCFDQVGDVCQVTGPDRVDFAAGLQHLRRELANRLQHRVSRSSRVTRRVLPQDQALGRQRRDRIQRRRQDG